MEQDAIQVDVFHHSEKEEEETEHTLFLGSSVPSDSTLSSLSPPSPSHSGVSIPSLSSVVEHDEESNDVLLNVKPEVNKEEERGSDSDSEANDLASQILKNYHIVPFKESSNPPNSIQSGDIVSTNIQNTPSKRKRDLTKKHHKTSSRPSPLPFTFEFKEPYTSSSVLEKVRFNGSEVQLTLHPTTHQFNVETTSIQPNGHGKNHKPSSHPTLPNQFIVVHPEEEEDESEQSIRVRRRNKYLRSKLIEHGIDFDDPESPEDDGNDLSMRDYQVSMCWKMTRRLAWLISMMLILSFSSIIMQRFDDLLDKHPILVRFIPVLIGTAGNAGSQLGVVFNRVLASKGSKPCKLLKQESCLSIFTSLILTFSTFLRIYAEYPDEIMTGVCISITLFISVGVAIILGMVFTVCIDKLKYCDAADGSIPLLTTVIDLIVIMLLCEISILFFPSTIN